MLRDGISEMLLSFGRYWMQHGTDLLKVSEQMNVNIYFCYFDTQKEWRKRINQINIDFLTVIYVMQNIYDCVCVCECVK